MKVDCSLEDCGREGKHSLLEASVREWGEYLRDRKEKAGKAGRGARGEKRMRETRTRADLTSPCCFPPHGPRGVTKVSQEELTPNTGPGLAIPVAPRGPTPPLSRPSPQPPTSTQIHSSHPPGRVICGANTGQVSSLIPAPPLRASIHEKHQRRQPGDRWCDL